MGSPFLFDLTPKPSPKRAVYIIGGNGRLCLNRYNEGAQKARKIAYSESGKMAIILINMQIKWESLEPFVYMRCYIINSYT